MEHLHLRVVKTGLIILGVWPSTFAKNPLQKKAYIIYSNTLQYYFYYFVFTQYVEVYFLLYDFQTIVNNLGVSLLYTLTSVKTIVSTSKKMRKLLDQTYELEQKLLNSGDEEKQKIYKPYVQINHFINKGMYVLGVVTIIPFFVNPIIEERVHPEDYVATNYSEYRKRPLPFYSWFPFNKYKYYKLAYFIHIITGCYGCCFVVVIDLLFVALMIFSASQLNILKYDLRNFKSKSTALIKPGFSQEEHLIIYLRECAVKHQVLIRFINDLNKVLQFPMLLDFIICSLQIAVLAFQVIIIGFSAKQIFALEYLLSMLCQLFLLYWFANEIQLESVGVSMAIYESKWYECNKTVKQILLIMMIRSQRPLTLTVGPFYDMSTQTALAILRASYSYVAVMRQNYMRKRN